MLQVTFVGTGPFQRLPEVLAGPGVRITVVGGRRNPLRRSQFVDEFVEFVELDDGADGIAGALLARPDAPSWNRLKLSPFFVNAKHGIGRQARAGTAV